MKKNYIMVPILWMLVFLELKKVNATKYDYQWMVQQDNDESLISVLEVLNIYIDEDTQKNIQFVDIPFFSDHSLTVEIKNNEGSYTYEIPYVYKMYDDLSEFNQCIFDYYKLNKKQVASVIGFSYDNKICIRNMIGDSYSSQDCYDGGFRVGNQNLVLYWDKYASDLDDVPEYFKNKIKFHLNGYERPYFINLLVDSRDSFYPVLLAIFIEFEQEDLKIEWKYVGPKKIRKVGNSLDSIPKNYLFKLNAQGEKLNKSF